jgi:hypothetical protein
MEPSQNILSLLFVFGFPFDTDHLSIQANRSDDNGPTAHTAILDVLLMLDRAIYQHVDMFPAVWTLNRCCLDFIHGVSLFAWLKEI